MLNFDILSNMLMLTKKKLYRFATCKFSFCVRYNNKRKKKKQEYVFDFSFI